MSKLFRYFIVILMWFMRQEEISKVILDQIEVLVKKTPTPIDDAVLNAVRKWLEGIQSGNGTQKS